eukprot:TRINITY_DN1256_c1_g1_i1.p1 TRINITY_DN1256_c1_g1~~TRINITY_DN1256_c1_g1_i1.p1  ORF type:complete len:424 (+),score=66.50 TRINITY_DN1256_c1_g1_i1:47-1318(+)
MTGPAPPVVHLPQNFKDVMMGSHAAHVCRPVIVRSGMFKREGERILLITNVHVMLFQTTGEINRLARLSDIEGVSKNADNKTFLISFFSELCEHVLSMRLKTIDNTGGDICEVIKYFRRIHRNGEELHVESLPQQILIPVDKHLPGYLTPRDKMMNRSFVQGSVRPPQEAKSIPAFDSPAPEAPSSNVPSSNVPSSNVPSSNVSDSAPPRVNVNERWIGQSPQSPIEAYVFEIVCKVNGSKPETSAKRYLFVDKRMLQLLTPNSGALTRVARLSDIEKAASTPDGGTIFIKFFEELNEPTLELRVEGGARILSIINYFRKQHRNDEELTVVPLQQSRNYRLALGPSFGPWVKPARYLAPKVKMEASGKYLTEGTVRGALPKESPVVPAFSECATVPPRPAAPMRPAGRGRGAAPVRTEVTHII